MDPLCPGTVEHVSMVCRSAGKQNERDTGRSVAAADGCREEGKEVKARRFAGLFLVLLVPAILAGCDDEKNSSVCPTCAEVCSARQVYYGSFHSTDLQVGSCGPFERYLRLCMKLSGLPNGP